MDILIAGVGGQGTVLASRLIGTAALSVGLFVRGSETIGMAQRGGSVLSHARLSDKPIDAPLIARGQADTILAMEPGEAARALPYLKPTGALVVSDRALQPPSGAYDAAAILAFLQGAVERLTVLEGALVARLWGTRFLNVALLGAALSLRLLPFGFADMEKALVKTVPDRYLIANIEALYCYT